MSSPPPDGSDSIFAKSKKRSGSAIFSCDMRNRLKSVVDLIPDPRYMKHRPAHDDVVYMSSRSLIIPQISTHLGSILPALDFLEESVREVAIL